MLKRVVPRSFYPKDFSFTPEFIKAVEKESKRLKLLKIDKKRILQKLLKLITD